MSELTPITRVESYLDAIVNSGIPPTEDITRIETFLQAIYDNVVCELTPITRIEMFLGKISGQSLTLPEPITRIELYLAAIAGEDVELPENPITRLEMYLADWADSGDWTTISGAIVEFITQRAHALKQVVVDINPVQDLHGYDSPWPEGGGVNKYPILIGEDAFTNNSGGSHSNDNGILVVNATTTASSGVYSTSASQIANKLMEQTGTVTYSFDIKSNIATRAVVGYEGVGSKTVDVNTSWQRVVITATVPSSLKLFIVYGTTTAATFYVKDFQLESGSTATAYSPYSNICPISGWTGVEVERTGHNIWDEEWELGTFGAQGQPAISNNSIRCKNYISVVPGETYIYVNGTAVAQAPWLYDRDKNFIARYSPYMAPNQTITIPDGCYYIKFALPATYGTTYRGDVSWNYPSTDTQYHAYTGNSYSVTWEDEVFGGSAEVVEGKRINDRTKLKLLSSFAWQIDGTEGNDRRFGFSYSSNPSVIRAINQNGTYISNMLAPWNIGLNSHDFGTFYISNSWIVIHDKNSHFATLDDFKDWLDSEDVYLVYKIATPVETTITPTPITALKGYNAMWSDAGDIEVTVHGTPVEVETLQALNMLLGGAYRNNQTADDVSDEEALDIILGGENR